MRTIAKILGALLTWGLVWAGCSDDPQQTTDDPLAGLPKAYARVECGRVFACCDAAERDDVLLFDPAPATQAECEARYESFFGAVAVDLRKGIEAGRIVYDEARADTCFTKAEAAACADFFGSHFFDEDPDCEAMFQGTVALGGGCLGDDECEDPGASCAGASGTELGTCKAPPGAGEPCQNGLCGPGLTCRLDEGMLKCVAPTADGAACDLDIDCQSGYCDFQAGICAAPAPVGGACAVNAGCASGYCDVGAGMCAAKKADGAACMTSVECASGFCDDAAGMGACAPTKPDGATCMVSAECTSGFCDAGACSPSTGAPVCDGL